MLLVTSLKEGSEDLQRARSDRDENQRKVVIVTFENGQVIETTKETQQIKAGDIIKMTGLTQVPVDMILILSSMYADGNQCYIETANIDGETNLKLREAPTALLPIVGTGEPTEELFSGRIEFEAPNKIIHSFSGAMYLDSVADPIPLSIDNMLLRSALFSNTDWGYGIAIYAGQETKVQMNNRHAKSKMSKLEQYLNKAIIIIFISQIVLVSVSVISIYILGFNNTGELPYVFPPGSKSVSILPLWLENW